jgi:hypothetical protein
MEDAVDITIVELGLGKVVSNYGTYEGKPAIFLEPVATLGIPNGTPGTLAPDTPKNALAPGSVVLRIHDSAGAHVVMEDLVSAMNFAAGQNRNIPKVIE